MNHTELSDRVRQIFAVFDGQDVAAFTALMTEDVQFRLGNAEAAQGKPAFVAEVEAFLASVARFDHKILDLWIDGDVTVIERRRCSLPDITHSADVVIVGGGSAGAVTAARLRAAASRG